MTISLCIATYRRNLQLQQLLHDIDAQSRLPEQLVVVDNHAPGTAREVLQPWLDGAAKFAVRYEIQPLQNISITRNRTVALATGDWLAFIDDDERAPASWLEQLSNCATAYAADGVLGPVVPILPDDAPGWMHKGGFYDWARMPTGTLVPANKLRLGNALIKAALLRGDSEPFDPAYGITGGEDGDLLARLLQQGARIVWCDEAVVHEPVVRERLSLRWLLRRSLRGGQDFALHTIKGRYGDVSVFERGAFAGRWLMQLFVATVLAAVTWPAGRHHAAHWLISAAANLGKLSSLSGWRYREYAKRNPS